MPKTTWIQNALNSGELSPYMKGRSDTAQYQAGCEELQNFILRSQGGASRRSGFRFVHACFDHTKRSRMIPFIFGVEQAYTLEFSDLNIRVFKDEGMIAGPVDIVTTYTEAELSDLQYFQSADTMYLVHPSHPPAKLTRTSHTVWTLSNVSMDPPPFLSENDTTRTMTPSSASGAITITASSAYFAATDVGRWVAIKHSTKWGWAEITGFTSTTVVNATTRRDYNGGGAKKEWKISAFGSAATVGYPRVGTFHEQRLYYASTPGNPQSIFGSVSGKPDNFTFIDEDGLTLAEHAFTFTLFSKQVNVIRWLSSQRAMMIGTTSQLHSLQATSAFEAITPTNVNVLSASYTPCAAIAAFSVDDAVVFVSRSGEKLFAVGFEVTRDTYVPEELSIFADHIGIGGFEQIDIANEPRTTIWAVRADGTLCACTYLRNQKVLGWHRHVVGGSFAGGPAVVESVAVIPAPSGDHDQVWITVKRTINGSTFRSVEFLEQDLKDSDAVEDCFFVDCGLSYDGAAITGPFAVPHLIGQTVQILADGCVLPSQVVPGSGNISISAAASVVHIGLGFTPKLKIMSPETPDAEGSTQAKLRRADHAILRLHRTIGGKVGQDETHLDDLLTREASADMNEATPFYSGDFHQPLDSDSDHEAQVIISHDQPLPITVLAVLLRLNSGER